MHRRPILALSLAATVTLSSCSVVEDLTGPDPQPPPSASAEELVLDSVLTGTSWDSQDEQTLEDLVADHPEEGDATIEPEECAGAALVTADEDGQRAEIAGLTGATEDGTALPVLVVVKGGRSVEDLREAREDCLEMTVTAEDHTSEQEEEVRDGPEIDGADDSFELEGTYKSVPEEGEPTTLERYGIVAEVRGVLVVVMANPDYEDEDSTVTLPINDATKQAVAEVVRAQVDKIRTAS